MNNFEKQKCLSFDCRNCSYLDRYYLLISKLFKNLHHHIIFFRNEKVIKLMRSNLQSKKAQWMYLLIKLY